MPIYGIIEENTITNTIVAESKEIAESVTGNLVILLDGTEMGINWSKIDNDWMPPQPYPSWIKNGQVWEAPVPMPEQISGYFYSWSEEQQSWLSIEY